MRGKDGPPKFSTNLVLITVVARLTLWHHRCGLAYYIRTTDSGLGNTVWRLRAPEDEPQKNMGNHCEMTDIITHLRTDTCEKNL